VGIDGQSRGGQRPTLARASQNMAMATVTVLLDTLLAPSTDGMDKVYQQLKTILGTAATQ
jgi:hypothetical protein